MPPRTNPKNDPRRRSLATRNLAEKRGSGRVAAVVIGLLLAVGSIALFQKVMGWDEPCGRSWSHQVNAYGDTTKVSLRSGRCVLRAEIRGDVRFGPDESSIAWIGTDARLEIEQKKRDDGGMVVHELSARPGDHPRNPEVTYRRDGDVRPLDAEARAWLRGVALELYRRVGLDAEARAERFWEEGGIDALLAEVEEIGADHVAATYLETPLRLGDATEVSRTLDAAARRVGSDHALANLLAELAAAERWDVLLAEAPGAELASALSRAVAALGSDYEQRRAISALLRSLPTGAAAADLEDALLSTAAEGLGSDYEAAELVELLATRAGEGRPLPPSALRLLDGIGSDFELRRALEALVERDPPATDRAELVRLAARRIGSDYELAELLLAVLRRDPSPEVEAEVEEALAAVGSDHDRDRVERTLED